MAEARRPVRRPLLFAALAGLALLVSSAVFAPLLANDRPYYLEAVDTGAYERDRRTLEPVAAALSALVHEGPVGDPERWRERVEAEVGAARRRASGMRAVLAGPDGVPLDELGLALTEVLDALDGPQRARRRAAVDEVARLVAVVAGELVASGVTGGRVELSARVRWPLFASLSLGDLWAMLAWTLALAWPLARRVLPPARGARAAAFVLGPLALALGLSALSPSAAARGGLSLKQGLSSGEIVPVRVVLPPVFFGYAETHTEEGLRPPTWTRAAARDEAGRPLHALGARAPDPGLAGLEPQSAPVEVRFGEPARNASWRRLAGTDAVGRDLFARLLWGGRVSLSVGLLAALGLTLVGLVLGGLAGYFGGPLDFFVSRTIEVVLSIPALFLIVLAAAYVDPDALHPIAAIVAIIALVSWTGVARLVRAELLRLRQAEFILAARAAGFSPLRVLFFHALPNALSPVLVAATFAVGGGILTESVVSYLGFGVRHPFPSWGALINESRSAEHWWIQLLPGLCIFAAVTATNLVGEALRDALDPRAEGPRP